MYFVMEDKNCLKDMDQFEIRYALSQEKIDKQPSYSGQDLSTRAKAYNGKINIDFFGKKHPKNTLLVFIWQAYYANL